MFTLKSAHGKFVTVELNGSVTNTRTETGAWEQFNLVSQDGRPLQDGSIVALQSWTGKWVCAEQGGGGVVIADRGSVGPWESFQLVFSPDGGTVAFLAWDRVHYLCAEPDGRVNATRTQIGPWETFSLDPAIQAGAGGEFSGAKGQARLMGRRSVGDDEGPKNYVGLSRFPWLWFWKFERDRVLRELDADRAAGFRYGRVLAQVGDPKNAADYWAGRIVDPDWPDYQELIAGLTNAALERGHLIEWTIFGKGGPYDATARRPDLVRRVTDVLKGNTLGVLFGEIMNEPNVVNSIADEELKALAAQAKAAVPVLPWATGAFWFEPEDGDPTDPGRYERALVRTQTTDLDIEHLDRDTSKSEEQDRPWRQGWDHGLTDRRWCDNEPIGPGSSVNRESRPDVLRSHRAVNFVCGAFASCLHGRPGVRGDLLWETEPAYYQAAKAVRFLPGNLVEGKPQNSNTNYPDRPFYLDEAFLRAKNGNTRGIVRAYSILTDGIYYTIAFGPVSPFELKAERNLTVQCVQQDAGALLWERDVAAGERLAFDGSVADVLLISRPR